MAEERKHNCPICDKELTYYARYPRYICGECAANPVDEAGRPLEFGNISITGGFIAVYADSGEERDSHICYVSGVKCYADEARFGGIVIQVCNDAMDELNQIEAVTERDIDLLLLEELNVSEDFASWFYTTIIQSVDAPGISGAWHSVSDPQLGESDLIAVYEDGIAILIENKIDAIAQPEQGNRYRQRGEKGIADGFWNEFVTCMIAPERYLQQERDSSVYDATLSYEEISKWFLEQDNPRSSYKSYLINEGIEQNRRGYTVVPDDAVTEFWFKYWSLASQQYPELEMKQPNIKPAGSDWVDFRPSALDKRLSIVHKLARGDVDLQVAGARGRIEELQEILLDYDVEVASAGKSVAIRKRVSPLNRSGPFESQHDVAVAGLNAAKELLELGVQIVDRI